MLHTIRYAMKWVMCKKNQKTEKIDFGSARWYDHVQENWPVQPTLKIEYVIQYNISKNVLKNQKNRQGRFCGKTYFVPCCKNRPKCQKMKILILTNFGPQ